MISVTVDDMSNLSNYWAREGVRLFRSDSTLSKMKKTDPRMRFFIDSYLQGRDISRPQGGVLNLSLQCCKHSRSLQTNYFHIRSFVHLRALYSVRKPWAETLIIPSPFRTKTLVLPVDPEGFHVPLCEPKCHKGCFLTDTGLLFFVITENRIGFSRLTRNVGDFLDYLLIKACNPLTHLLACYTTQEFKYNNRSLEDAIKRWVCDNAKRRFGLP